MQVPVPDASSLVRLVAGARHLPSTAAMTARALPDLAKLALADGGRRAVGAALNVTGAAVSGAASVATSFLARTPHGAAGDPRGDGAEVLDLRPDDAGNRFASAYDEAAQDEAGEWAAADPQAVPTDEAIPDLLADVADAEVIAEPAPEAVEAGAPGTATEAADRAEAEVGMSTPASSPTSGADLSPDDLPLPDFDHMTVGSLRARLRSLDIAQLVTLRSYEQAHAHRLQVVTMLENRIAKLEKDAAAASDD